MSGEITFIQAGKIHYYITGKLRNDTPEENVRQRFARSLVEEYGYYREDIEIEFRISLGRARERVDIAIFTPNSTHSQESITIIAETKTSEVKPTDRDNGVE